MSQGFIENLISTLTGIGIGTPASGNLRNCTGYPLPTNYVLSSSCGAYTQSTSTPTQVTNLSCTITTTGGYVQVVLQPDNSGNEAYCNNTAGDLMNLYVYKGASALCRTLMCGPTASYSNPNITFNDYTVVGTPGTYTYHIFMSSNSGLSASLSYAQLSVTEL